MAAVLLIIFSVLSYGLFFNAPKAKAATVDSSSDASALGTTQQRHEVVSSNGTIVAVFDTGTQDVTGLAYAVSTDNGATWSSATQIDSNQIGDYSVAIDGADNIYVTYSNGTTYGANVYIRELSYSGGSWSVGSATVVFTGIASCPGTKIGYQKPSVAINSAGVVAVTALISKQGCSPISLSTGNVGAYSTNLSSWTFLGGLPDNMFTGLVAAGLSFWAVGDFQTGMTLPSLFSDTTGSGTWVQVPNTSVTSTAVSVAYGLDSLHLFYATTGGLIYYTYNIATATLSSPITVSSSTNDVRGEVSTDSQNVWLAYQSYVGASSYNVVYKTYNTVSQSLSGAASITADNLNNTLINLPERVAGSANVPVVWESGTGSPYTLKSASFSTVGTVTDTGNQTGAYIGSLTGSSGDTIVKCGVWYYGTINIVAGMTVKVCPSNGQAGGSLELHANSIVVAGTIDGAGRGFPGGVAVIAGTGGAGGAAAAAAANGNTGMAGTSVGGASGSGTYAGAGGAGGANGTPGGTAGTSSGGTGTGGGGGAGGTVVGTSGSLGGYLGSGINGDSSTDLSLSLGSGGGGGGTGGAGAGGGSGGGGSTVGSSAGGGGAAGGAGGKGGDGGAAIKIYSNGTLSVTGSILTTGQAGGSGGAGSSGQA